MRRLLPFIVALLPTIALCQDSRLEALRTGDDLGVWSGVGRLEIEGKGFCTAALVSQSQVLTAAHCLYDRDGTRVSVSRVTFAAGLRDDRPLATRAVRRSVVHPDFSFDAGASEADMGTDVALLELQQPIRGTSVLPFSIAAQPTRDDRVAVVSYAAERAEAPALQKVCQVLDTYRRAMVLTCSVDFGSSGAPVFVMSPDGTPSIVGVVTAKAVVADEDVAVSANAELNLGLLTELMSAQSSTRINSVAGQARVIAPGERANDTGAKFIRP